MKRLGEDAPEVERAADGAAAAVDRDRVDLGRARILLEPARRRSTRW